MQQAIYNKTITTGTVATGTTSGSKIKISKLVKTLRRSWDLVGVVTLLMSAGGYAVYALMHMS